MPHRKIGATQVVLPQRLPSLQHLADYHDVPLERVIEVIRARAVRRSAIFHRKRSRRRSLERNPDARRRAFKLQACVGEGEFEILLRESGMTKKQFAELAGVGERTIGGWQGHPLPLWPVQLLYFVIWSRGMAAFLASKGWKPEDFQPRGLPPAPGGRYPRTVEQVEQLRSDAREAVKGG